MCFNAETVDSMAFGSDFRDWQVVAKSYQGVINSRGVAEMKNRELSAVLKRYKLHN